MNIGKIARVIGPVVDVEFEEGKLPAIRNGLLISNPAIDDTADNLVVEVAHTWATTWCAPSPWTPPTAWYGACR